jgi:hypothetical protein
MCEISTVNSADGGTDGSGAVAVQLTLPYATSYAQTLNRGLVYTSGQDSGSPFSQFCIAEITTGANFATLIGSAGGTLTNGAFTNGARNINGTISYKAY